MSIPPTSRIGFLGAGNMAEAILHGLVASKSWQQSQLYTTDLRAERVAELEKALGVRSSPDAAALVAQCDVVVIAVKPQGVRELLSELAGSARTDQVWISILAGTPATALEELLAHAGAPAPRVVRVMPNTPALVGAGASGICAGTHATDDDLGLARSIFAAVGIAEIVDPDMMDAITGVTGSGPAYVFRLIEALTEAGVAQGFPPEQSSRLVKHMVFGAAKMALESEHDPGELRRRVTSPGGTTAEGLKVMEDAQFGDLIKRVVEASAARSRELAKS